MVARCSPSLAKIARDRGCGRMEWAVLNWNEPAIKFYQALGAKPMNEWTVFRLTRDEIAKLANDSVRGAHAPSRAGDSESFRESRTSEYRSYVHSGPEGISARRRNVHVRRVRSPEQARLVAR